MNIKGFTISNRYLVALGILSICSAIGELSSSSIGFTTSAQAVEPVAASGQQRNSATSQLAQNPQSNTDFPADIVVSFARNGRPYLTSVPGFIRQETDRFFAYDQRGYKVYFTIDPGLQERSELILKRYRMDYGALVAVSPETGKILSFASHSTREPGRSVVTQARFPAASLIKVITAAAAVENAGMKGDDSIMFHGGNYTLERFNYLPDPRKDTRSMTLGDALAKSVNPVFARVALGKFRSRVLTQYAETFGFNETLIDEIPVETSQYNAAFDDYNYARTAAGFGPVYVSPLHAAVIAATTANKGTMMRPYLIENIVDGTGLEIYRARPSVFKQAVLPSTATELMSMMEGTVSDGTARRAFSGVNLVPVAGKTGTLSGSDPKGLYTWFIGAAPTYHPELAIAALAIDTGGSTTRGSFLARNLLDFYFRRRFGMAIPELASPPVKTVARGQQTRGKAGKKRVVQKGKGGRTTAPKAKAASGKVGSVKKSPAVRKPVKQATSKPATSKKKSGR